VAMKNGQSRETGSIR